MAAAGLAAMAVGGVLQGYSSHLAGKEASRNATLAASQLEENAKMYDTAAGQQQAIAQRKAAESKRQNRLLQSRIIAVNAAGGGSSGEKNVADLLSKTEGEGEYSALNYLFEGDTRAQDLRNRATSTRNQAKTTLYEGRSARSAGNIGAISGLLSTAGSMASFKSKYGNQSALDNGYTTQPQTSGYSQNYDLDF